MSLREAQETLWRFARGGPLDDPALRRLFADPPRGDLLTRLWIHRGGYWARHLEAMGESYPLLRQRLTADDFARLVEAYVVEHPSTDGRLEWLGRLLPSFLRENPRPALRVWADLAAYEWAICEAFLAVDPPSCLDRIPLEPAAFASATATLVPAFRLVTLESDPTAPPDSPESGPVTFAVCRKGFRVSDHRLEADEAAALRRLATGARMADVCEAFAGGPDPAARAVTAVGRWLRRGYLEALHPEIPSTAERS
jgi:hypothetical protein